MYSIVYSFGLLVSHDYKNSIFWALCLEYLRYGMVTSVMHHSICWKKIMTNLFYRRTFIYNPLDVNIYYVLYLSDSFMMRRFLCWDINVLPVKRHDSNLVLSILRNHSFPGDRILNFFFLKFRPLQGVSWQNDIFKMAVKGTKMN